MQRRQEARRLALVVALNEDLAATAVWGSQQTNLFAGAKYDGVFGMWYGKGPGLDRSMDVLIVDPDDGSSIRPNTDGSMVGHISWTAGGNGLLRGLLNGWQISGITSYQSGWPLRIVFSGDLATDAMWLAWWGTDAHRSGEPNGRAGAITPVFVGDPRTGHTGVGDSIIDVDQIGIPALGETVYAAVGHGCHWNGRPASVSRVSTLERSLVLTTDVEEILARPQGTGWRRLAGAAHTSRTWGDAYGHILVATGRAELMVDPILSDWDAAPLLPILSEAGGRFTDLSGRATVRGGSAVSSNGLLHTVALEALAGD